MKILKLTALKINKKLIEKIKLTEILYRVLEILNIISCNSFKSCRKSKKICKDFTLIITTKIL
jgi:hypothetical protein